MAPSSTYRYSHSLEVIFSWPISTVELLTQRRYRRESPRRLSRLGGAPAHIISALELLEKAATASNLSST